MWYSLRLQAQIFSFGVQSNLIYRWNFIMRVLVGFVPLLGSVFLWQAVFQGRQAFAGYTYDAMVAYFITIILVNTLVLAVDDEFQMAEDIREGQINALLLKPLDYRLFRFHLFLSARVVHSLFSLLPLAFAMIWLGHFYQGLPWLTYLPFALLAAFGAAVMQYLLTFTIGSLSFWILDIGSVAFILYSVEFLLGGQIFPIDAFPGWLHDLSLHLPFAYETWFPAAILIGHVQGNALWQGFAWQWAWIGFFYVLSGVMWKRGMNVYTAVGG